MFICLCCLNESPVIASTLLEMFLRKIFLDLLSVWVFMCLMDTAVYHLILLCIFIPAIYSINYVHVCLFDFELYVVILIFQYHFLSLVDFLFIHLSISFNPTLGFV